MILMWQKKPTTLLSVGLESQQLDMQKTTLERKKEEKQ